MPFSRILFLIIFLSMSGAQASDLKNIIQSREYGSCQSSNLSYSAMKFYKIPLNEKYDNYDLYLRILLFFNLDGTLSLRTTTQALLGCQTTSNGDQACSYHPLDDSWMKTEYVENGIITVSELGLIRFKNPSDTNRGFELTFKNDFHYPHLQNQSFIGGIVAVNFNQDGINTINICN